MHFYFFQTYNELRWENGGAIYVFSTLYNRNIWFYWIFKISGFRCSDIFKVGTLFPEPLSAEEERNCLIQMTNGDEEARNLLIERNLRLVAHVAKKYTNTVKVDQDDLISIGTIGLIKGINSYNIEKGSRLSTYVSRCIDNEILMHLRATKKLGAEVYLNEPIGKDKDDNVVTLQEVLENNERNIEDEVDIKMKIKVLFEKMKSLLKDREKTILELRFGLGGKKPKTQNEIAKMMGISRSYVSRIETKAIHKLSQEMKD